MSKATASEAPKAEHTPTFRKADPQRLQQADAARMVWCYTAPVGTRLEDIMQPQYWAQLGPNPPGAWDRLEVREEMGAFWCEFLVTESAPGYLKLAPIKGIELEGVGPRRVDSFDAEGLRVEYRGPHLKWCVMGKDATGVDRQLTGGFAQDDQAASWLRDYIKRKNAK